MTCLVGVDLLLSLLGHTHYFGIANHRLVRAALISYEISCINLNRGIRNRGNILRRKRLLRRISQSLHQRLLTVVQRKLFGSRLRLARLVQS